MDLVHAEHVRVFRFLLGLGAMSIAGGCSQHAMHAARPQRAVAQPLATGSPAARGRDAPAVDDARKENIDAAAQELARRLVLRLHAEPEAFVAELAVPGLPVALSHDRKQLAFVGREGSSSSLWLVATDGSRLRKVFDAAVDAVAVAVAYQGEPPPWRPQTIGYLRFSHDDRSIFFQTQGWWRRLALHRLDIETRATVLISDSTDYYVIEDCADQRLLEGNLIVRSKVDDALLGESLELYQLLDTEGHRRGLIGGAYDNVARYLQKTCGPTPPNLPPQVVVPRQLKAFPRCAGGVLRYAPVPLLDGTQLPYFYLVKAEHSHAPVTLDTALSGPLLLREVQELFAKACPGPLRPSPRADVDGQ